MSGILFPICGSCSRARIRTLIEGTYCAVYPQGMPEIVTQYGFDHRNPLPDDNGVQWERTQGCHLYRWRTARWGSPTPTAE